MRATVAKRLKGDQVTTRAARRYAWANNGTDARQSQVVRAGDPRIAYQAAKRNHTRGKR